MAKTIIIIIFSNYEVIIISQNQFMTLEHYAYVEQGFP